jgi:hypothetical protein
MDGETSALGEALTALVAAEGFLARVRPTMDNKNAAPGKALTALVAVEGFLARVRPTMDGEVAAPGKALAALVAAVGFIGALVFFQTSRRSHRRWPVIIQTHVSSFAKS